MNPSAEPGCPPRHIVSAAPSITDSLLALGLGRYLVGVTDLCPLPDGMKEIARVGRPETIHRAVVAGLHPDLLLATEEENSPGQIEEWKRSGLPVWVSSPRTVRRAVADLRDLVLMFPSDSALQSVVWLERSVDWMTGSMPETRIRVFCPRTRRGSADNPQSWEAVGGGSYAGDLLSLCGAETACAGSEPGSYPVVTPEQVIAAAPEVILLPGATFPFAEEDAAAIRSSMPGVPAVESNRVLPVDGRLIFWPGAMMGEAIRILPALLNQRE